MLFSWQNHGTGCVVTDQSFHLPASLHEGFENIYRRRNKSAVIEKHEQPKLNFRWNGNFFAHADTASIQACLCLVCLSSTAAARKTIAGFPPDRWLALEATTGRLLAYGAWEFSSKTGRRTGKPVELPIGTLTRETAMARFQTVLEKLNPRVAFFGSQPPPPWRWL